MNKRTTLNTYYKCKNDYENNLAIQNEIFKIYDFDFGGGKWRRCLHNVIKKIGGNSDMNQ